jgi:hypothetical protein
MNSENINQQENTVLSELKSEDLKQEGINEEVTK